jgi:hypothetical protein
MKEYPHIQGSSKAPHEPCVAFCKYDGSNLRAEWTKKRGWYKFGSRGQMIDEKTPILGEGIVIFLEKYGDDLARILTDSKDYRNRESAIAFFEFFGSNSFAGIHVKGDPKDVVLFDVNIHKMGLLGPSEFRKNFGTLDIAEVVHEGILNEEFKQGVRDGSVRFTPQREIKNKIWEGVVCKGGSGHKLWMAKVKTDAYRIALQELFSGQWEKYFE